MIPFEDPSVNHGRSRLIRRASVLSACPVDWGWYGVPQWCIIFIAARNVSNSPMEWVPLSVATAIGTPNLKITCSAKNLVLSSAVARTVARASVHFVNASVQVIIHDLLDDVTGKSMIQSKYKRSNGSTTYVGRSSFDFGHLLHC